MKPEPTAQDIMRDQRQKALKVLTKLESAYNKVHNMNGPWCELFPNQSDLRSIELRLHERLGFLRGYIGELDKELMKA